ncbi:type IVB secretion system protein IcmM/DotJ [Legionella londiniensis]|uniref:Dot/Icm secretion system protein ImcM n=1 Tax=Legionella londiniensis TaxID=45068 RepID=A0A0W0VMQ0_9GAMM|nr:type IVB secretion system protein IcmM/DotJ [Legionella londiniensis]KTD21065.1 Dot/Icm secretion system protein ImcM [Legionella londiniensis]STX93641.1 Component of the Dot/Icm secretion system. inner membrane protein [Legionella londiniensis]
MSRRAWQIIKNSKGFYVRTYRSSIRVLVISIFLNLILGVLIYYTYFSRPEPDFYATNGVTPPVQLTPLDQPNYTSEPLLPDEVETETDNKVIPQ